jgi:hypothetical protein
MVREMGVPMEGGPDQWVYKLKRKGGGGEELEWDVKGLEREDAGETGASYPIL